MSLHARPSMWRSSLVSLSETPAVRSFLLRSEEMCDLNPQKTCRLQTKLVPQLAPKHECTIVPKETCLLKFSQPRQVPKPLQTRWCLDPTPAAPGQSYDEDQAFAAPLDLSDLGRSGL